METLELKEKPILNDKSAIKKFLGVMDKIVPVFETLVSSGQNSACFFCRF